MNVRLMLVSAVFASSALLSQSANAHEPKEFDRMLQVAETQSAPTTCVQLADRGHYASDASNVEIKALKARCDAEKKAVLKTKHDTAKNSVGNIR